jgi:hypothetical protein
MDVHVGRDRVDHSEEQLLLTFRGASAEPQCMATDNDRGNRFAAPGYLQTRLFIVSRFRRMLPLDMKSGLRIRISMRLSRFISEVLQRVLDVLQVDFAPRAPSSSSACILFNTHQVGRPE